MKRLALPLCLMLLAAIAKAQQPLQPSVINSSGGAYQDISVRIDWTMGELVMSTIDANGSFLTQGFLQPDLSALSAVTPSLAEVDIVAFPNPVERKLTFQTERTDPAAITVYNILGRPLRTTAFVNEFDMGSFATGPYFISVLDSKENIIKIFKIIKK